MPVANYGTAALAQMANARQKFTNEQYAQTLRDRKNAEEQAAREKEMSTRSAYGMIGSGVALGAMTGNPIAGAVGGLGLGMLGEMGTRMGQGESFGKALGHTVGRLPTANEVMQIGTGAMGGIVTNKLLAGKQALATQAQANQPTLQQNAARVGATLPQYGMSERVPMMTHQDAIDLAKAYGG
jgi:hypothetical protein